MDRASDSERIALDELFQPLRYYTFVNSKQRKSSPNEKGTNEDHGRIIPGARVQIVGLKVHVESNGRTGICQKWETQLSAWTVVFENGDRFPFREENLVSIMSPVGSDDKFLDPTFPPSDASLGHPREASRSFIDAGQRKSTQWLRLPDLIQQSPESSVATLWGEISPQALKQGKIGNCWALAAIAALAEFPHAVRNLFSEADVHQGRYVIKLFDMSRAAWEHVEIDDHVPCLYEEDKSGIASTTNEDYETTLFWDGTPTPMKWVPVFGSPNGAEMWAVLLEKAIAKFVGSYAWIAGGSEQFALIALTGMPLAYGFIRSEPVCQEGHVLQESVHEGDWICDGCATQFTKHDTPKRFRCHACDFDLCVQCFASRRVGPGTWHWFGSQYKSRDQTVMACSSIRGDIPWQSDDGLWARLQFYKACNYLMTAAITNFQQPTSSKGFYRRDGLVLGHAYTVLDCRSAQKIVDVERRDILEWIDQDGDLVGIERVGSCAYNVCNGKRWQPSGVQDTIHIVSFDVSEESEKFQVIDSMGVVASGFIPKEKCAAAAQLWQRVMADEPAPVEEPEVLPAGTRVRFKGLVKQKDLNGRLGEVLDMQTEEARGQVPMYRVKLIIDIGHGDVGTLAEKYNYWVAVAKRQNLEVVHGVPGARGGAVRLVLLRNPHGNGIPITHSDGTTSYSTKWRGDWCDDSKLWEENPDVAEQVGYEPSNDGRFWMSWEDFRRTFSHVTVLPMGMDAPSSAVIFELEPHVQPENRLCWSLERMVEKESAYDSSPTLLDKLKKVEILFDPFEQFPSYLGEEHLDNKLLWLAAKPGRLQSFVDGTRDSNSMLHHDHVLQRVEELSLEGALGPTGQI